MSAAPGRLHAASDMTPATAPIQVAFVLMPDSLILDWAGPAEALRIANQCLRATGQPEAFALRFIGPESQTSSSVGAIISQIEPLPPDLSEPAWVVLVGQPGRTVDVDSDSARQLIRWLRALELAPGRLELLTVCAGAILAAHAGLLDGHRATTHHEHLDELLAWWRAQPLQVSFLPTPVAEYAFSRDLGHPTLRTLLIGGDKLRQFPRQQRQRALVLRR